MTECLAVFSTEFRQNLYSGWVLRRFSIFQIVQSDISEYIETTNNQKYA